MIVDSKRNKYLTTWEAAEKSGYTADYIVMLCRRGKVEGIRDGKSWLVDDASFESFLSSVRPDADKRRNALREIRLLEYKNRQQALPPVHVRTYGIALAQLFAAVIGISIFSALVAFGSSDGLIQKLNSHGTWGKGVAAISVSLNPLLTGETRTTTNSSIGSFTWMDIVHSFAGLFVAPQPQVVVVNAPATTTTKTTIVHQTVAPTTVVRNVSEYVTVTGITRAELDAAIAAAEARIRAGFPTYIPFSGAPATTAVNTQTFAVSQRIDVLDGVTIRNATIIGGSISGTSGIGSGSGSGTVNTGAAGQAAYFDASGTTVSATSSLFFATTQNIGIATSSPLAQLDLYGNFILSGTNRYLNFGSVSGSLGYGFRDNGGTLEFKNDAGSWSAIGSGSGGGADGNWSFFNNSGIRLATSTNQVVIGANSTSTLAKLEVVGDANISTNLIVQGNSTTTNATTTNLAVSNAATTSNLVVSNAFRFANLTGFLKATAGVVGTSLINLAADVTGTLGVSNGGTGSTSPAGFLYGPNDGTLQGTTTIAANFISSAIARVSQLVTTLGGLSDVSLGALGYGQLLSYNGSSWVNVATSTLGINFANLVGTASDSQVADNLTISAGTINNTPIGATTASTGVFTNATSTNATSTNQYVSNELRVGSLAGLIYGTTGNLSALANGTAGYVLSMSGGLPTWVSTSSISNGVSSLAQTFGTAQTGALTIATSSDTNILLNVTNSGGAFTFAPSWTGTLAVNRGGTGSTSPAGFLYGPNDGTLQGTTTIAANFISSAIARVSQLVTTLAGLTDVSLSGLGYGNLLSYNGSSWVNVATSTLGINFANLIGTASDSQVADNLTISAGTIENTPIGAATPSTGVFTNSTSTNATSTNQYISNQLRIGSLAGLLYGTTGNVSAVANSTGGFVLAMSGGLPTWVATSSINNGVSSLVLPQGSFIGNLTFATSSSAFNGLTASTSISGSGSTLTFTNTLAGLLTAGGGGTGIASPTAAGILLGSYAGGGWQQLATSSLGINFTSLIGSATDSQVTDALTISGGTINNTPIGASTASTGVFTNSTTTNATTTNQYVSGELTIGSLSGFLKATAGKIATAAINLASDVTGTLGVSNGGTGQTAFGQGILAINDSGGFISTTSPTVAYITATSTTATSTFAFGLKASRFNATATSTLAGIDITSGCFAINGTCLSTSGGVTSLAQTFGTAQTGALTIATSSSAFNGLTAALNITNTGGAFTFTTLLSGLLGVGGGGTGIASPTAAGILLGSYAGGGWQQLATSTLGINFTSLIGSATDAQVVDALTVSGGTIENTPIGAATPSTGVFTNATSTNATTTNLAILGTASTSELRVSTGFFQDGFTGCGSESDTVLYNATTGKFSCGTDSGASGSNEINWTFFNASGIRVSTTTNQVLIGSSATSTLAKLEVVGDANISTNLIVQGNSTTTNATTTNLAVSNNASTSNLVVSNAFRLANLTGFLKATAGVVSTATIDLVNDVGSSILAVVNGGTGWGNIQANTLLIGNGTSRLATTSAGTNGQVLALVSGVPTWVATSSINNGVSSLVLPQGSFIGNLTFATSSSAFNGLTASTSISGSGSTLTFTNTLAGLLTAGGGGTGISSPTAAGILLGTYAGGGWQQLATSSLGIAISDTTGTLAVNRGGTGSTSPAGFLYGPNDGTLQGTTTIAANFISSAIARVTQLVTTLGGLSDVSLGALGYGNLLSYNGSSWVNVATSTLGINFANLVGTASDSQVADNLTISAGTINNTPIGASTASTLVSTNATSTNATSTNEYISNQLRIASLSGLLLGTTGNVSAIANSTGGFVLAMSGGLPTWVATSSINNGVSSLQQLGGGTAQTGAITFATSSQTTNGQTIGLNITNSSGAFTFAPTISGTLTAGGGGTGISSPSSAGILLGAYGGGSWQQLSTSSLGIAFSSLTGTASDSQVADNLTISAGTIENTPIGAATPSTGVFTNSTSTNATSTNQYISNQLRIGSLAGLLYGTTGNVSAVANSTGGFVLSMQNGVPTWVATSSINNGVSSVAQTYGAAQTGAITLATSTQSFNGLTLGNTITNASGAFTLTPSVTGTLNNTGLSNSSITISAGTGLSGGAVVSLGGTVTLDSVWTAAGSPTNIYNNTAGNVGIGSSTPFAKLAVFGGGTYASQAASTLFAVGSTTAGTATTTLFSVSSGGVASSTHLVVSNSFTLANLTGFLKATAGVVSTATIDLANDVGSSILAVVNGGTGWGNIQANTLLIGNGTSRLATTSAGTNGQVLALVAGVPSWVSTSSINNGVSSLQQTYGTAQTGALTIATSSDTNILLSVTNSGGAFTFTPSFTGTLADSRVADNLTISAGTIENTPIGAATPSTGVFTNSTSTNATTTNLAVSGTATTSNLVVSNTFRLANLTGFLKATAGVIATATIDLVNDVGSSILAVANGGTGWANVQTNALLYGNGTGRLATTTQGTGGQILAMSGGIPTWVATTTFSSGLTYSAGNVTNTGVTSIVAGTNVTVSGATGAVTVNALGTSKWATSTDTFAIYPNGLTNPILGIGTTTPKYTLTVASSTRAQLALSDGSLTSDQWVMRSINNNFYLATSSPSTFATSTIPSLAITANGNFGIGTSSPWTDFVVKGENSSFASLAYGTWTTNSLYGALYLNGSQSANDFNFMSGSSDTSLYINRPTAGTIKFRSGNTDQMVISTTGNVGIGTSTPSFKLEVNGTARGTIYDVGGAVYNVKAYGAVGDSSTDDTQALQAAIDAANTDGGGVVYIPEGMYMTNTLTLYSNIKIKGAGMDTTVLKLNNGANQDVIKGYQFDSLTTTNSAGGIYGWALEDFSINGNNTNNLTGGAGVRVYGYDFSVRNVGIYITRDVGWYSEWEQGFTTPWPNAMESHVYNLKVHDSSTHGIVWAGPHDSVLTDPSAYENNGVGVWLKPGSDGTTVQGGHSYSYKQTYAWYLEATNLQLNGSVGETAQYANVLVGGNAATIVGGMYYTQPSAVPNQGCIQIGTSTHPTITHVMIDTMTTNCITGAINFYSTAAQSKIKLLSYATTGPAYIGTPSATTQFEHYGHGGANALVYQFPASDFSVGGAFFNIASTSGYVGIGTSTPRSLLTLATSTRPQLTLSDASLTSNPWNFRSINGSLYVATSSPSTFATSSDTRFSINSSGFVGVGTASPTSALTVAGVTPFLSITDTSGSGQSLIDFQDAGSSKWLIGKNAADAFAIWDSVAGRNAMQIVGNGDLQLQPTAGKVGIATSSAYAKLALQATAGQTYPVFEVASSSNASVFLSVAGTGFGTTTLSGLTISGSATSTSNVGFNLTGGCFAIGGTCITSLSNSASTDKFATSSDTFAIYPNGLTNPIVGIGTTTPKYTLTVASSTRAQFALSDASLTSDQFVLRSINNNLYFATSSAATSATSSVAFMSFDTNGTPTFAKPIPTTSGGTGLSTYTTGDTLYASATNVLSKLAAGTGGTVLSMVNGVPGWVATSSINNGVSSIAVPGVTLTGAVTFATSSTAYNGLTASTTITNSAGTLTFANTLAGTLGVAGGGTGLSSVATGDILYGSNTNTLSALTGGVSNNGKVLSIAGGIPSWVATTTFSSGLTYSAGNVGLSSIAAGTLLANGTGAAAVPTAVSTSTLYSGTAGQVLSFLNGAWIGAATTTFSGNLTYSAGNVTYTGPLSKWATSTDTFAIYPNGLTNPIVGIGTTTPKYTLTVASSTRAQLALSDGSLTNNQWVQRSINNNFYLATSSPSTFATSTVPALSVITGGQSGFVGLGSSTPWTNLVVQGNAFSSFAVGVWPGSSIYHSIYLNGQSAASDYNFMSSSGDSTSLFINRPTGGTMYFRAANADQMVLNPSGYLGIGTSTPQRKLTVSDATLPQLVLTDASLTSDQWTQRSINGNFYLATSSPSTFGTSTRAAIAVDTNGSVTLGKPLTETSGGTGQSTYTAGDMLYASGSNTLSKLAASTGGFVLAMSNGVPAWVSTSSINGISSLTVPGNTLTGAVTFATSSTAFNGLTASTTITNSANTLTFTNTLAGLLTAGGGGTGIASPSAAGILLGSYAGGSWQQLATSSLGVNFTSLIGSATDSQVTDALTISGGTINNTPIGASTASTAVFTSATSTNATTTNVYISGKITGAGLSSCSGSSDKLIWNATTGQFSCGADAGAGGGITALGAQYSTLQTGSSQTFATSSDTNIGLIITSSSDTHTFTPTWIGTLADSRVADNLTISAGTIENTPIGAATPSTGVFTNSTSTNATTTNLAVSGTATTSNLVVSNTFRLANLTGFLKATAGVIATATIDLVNDVGSSILAVANGGTGWANVQTNALLYGNGTGRLATTTQGTGGQILAMSGGIPTWVATTTFSSGLTYSAGNVTNTGVLSVGAANQPLTGAVILATTTTSFNGVFSANNITCIVQTCTFTNTLSGLLTAVGGGTGITNPSAAGVLLGSYASGSWQQLATSSLGIAISDTTGTLAATRGGTGQSTYATGDTLYASATNVLSKLAAGTGGTILSMVNGVPGWVATTTFSSGLTYSAGNVTNTGVTSIVAGTNVTVSGATGAVTVNALGTSKWATSTDTFAIYPNGLTNPILGIGTTTPKYTLTVASSTRAQLALSDGSLTSDQWVMRSINNNFYLATSSPSTFATSTVAALAFDTNGLPTFGGLQGSGTVCASITATGGLTRSASACGTGSASTDKWATSTDTFAIYPNGLTNPIVGIGTTTPKYTLTVASSTRAQLVLSDASLTQDQWAFRAVNGNLYVASSSASTFATSTLPLLTLSSSGKVGIGTTTPSGKLGIYIDQASGTTYGLEVVGKQTASAAASIAGANFAPEYISTTGTLSGLTGIRSAPSSSGGGIVSLLLGAEITPSNSVGTTTDMRSVYSAVSNTSGTTTSMYGVYSSTLASGGSVDTMYPLYSQCSQLNGSVVANCYGAYLAAASGTFGQQYGLYQAGAGDRNYFAGMVGIGTTTPKYTLTVASSTRAQLVLSDASLTQDQWAFRAVNGNLYVASSSASTFATSTNTRLSILSSGYVGIGTASPTSALTVSGVSPFVTVNDTSSSGQSLIDFQDAGASHWLVGKNAADAFAIWDSQSARNALQIVENGGVLQLQPIAGVVGIGTTSPVYALTVATTTGPQLVLTDGSLTSNPWTFRSINGSFYLASSSASTYATSTSAVLSFDTNGAPTFGSLSGSGTNCAQLSSTGVLSRTGSACGSGGASTDKWATSTDTFAIYPNGLTNPIVGIGTTTPKYTLTIASSTRAQLALSDGSLTQDQWVQRSINGNFYLATSSPSTFATSSVPSLSVTGLGVGLSTSTPWTDFVVRGKGSAFASLSYGSWVTNSLYGALYLNGSQAGNDYNLMSGGDTNLYINRPSTKSIYFRAANADQAIFTSTGFGIGTTTPQRKLTVSDATSPQISLTDTSLTQDAWNFRAINGNLYVSTSSASTFSTSTLSAIAIGSNGDVTFNAGRNVGIGTTTPNWSLQIASSTPYLALTDTDAGTDNKHILLSNIDGIFRIGTSTDALSSTSTALSLDPRGPAVFGIGTTSPWRTLSVVGGVAFNGLTSSATGNAVCITTGKDVTDAGGGTCTPSSQRFKENILTLSTGTALDELGLMRVVSFDYKADFTGGENPAAVGLIAEEVEQIDPRLVDYGYDGLPLTLHFERITGLTVQAIQELNLNLSAIASTTATTTPAAQSFAASFFARISAWFADSANGIGDFFANRVRTKELCVSDGTGETCITKSQLDSLIAGAGNSGGGGGGGGGGNPPPDTEPPVITLFGANPTTITVGDTYSDFGASVTDNVDTNLGITTTVDGEEMLVVTIDTSVAGEHTIIYSATDQAGNTGTATRTVFVEDPQ